MLQAVQFDAQPDQVIERAGVHLAGPLGQQPPHRFLQAIVVPLLLGPGVLGPGRRHRGGVQSAAGLLADRYPPGQLRTQLPSITTF